MSLNNQRFRFGPLAGNLLLRKQVQQRVVVGTQERPQIHFWLPGGVRRRPQRVTSHDRRWRRTDVTRYDLRRC